MPVPRLSDERGVALPLALMTLVLLSALMLAFASLSRTEPVIAANQLRVSQARALAESGVEYALWALSNPTQPAGLPSPLPQAAPPPFDGRTFLAQGPLGGFTVAVANDPGGDPHRRTISATGWAPSHHATDARPRAHRKVTVDVVVVPRLGRWAPCALCVRGPLTVTGNVAIDGRSRHPDCGEDTKYGTFTRDTTTVTGPVAISGGAGASAQHQPAAAFEPLTLSPAALEALKTMAWRNGTYYGPGFPGGGTVSDGQASWAGRIVFDASRPVPDGVVFVDTTDGSNVDPSSGGLATLAHARLADGAFAGDGIFHGWFVVNGSIEFAAGLNVRGLVYAVDGLAYQAAGAGRIEGLAVSLNIGETSAASLETVGGGELTVTFDCEHALAGGLVPAGFLPIPGTYREESD
jgi:hypothetical protein